jgi:hypothetical protein
MLAIIVGDPRAQDDSVEWRLRCQQVPLLFAASSLLRRPVGVMSLLMMGSVVLVDARA